MRYFTLKDCLPHGDEARAYYTLYGDLYFEVPHYVKSYEIDQEKISVRFPSGSGMSIWHSNR